MTYYLRDSEEIIKLQRENEEIKAKLKKFADHYRSLHASIERIILEDAQNAKDKNSF